MSLTHTSRFARYAKILTCWKWLLLLYNSANLSTRCTVCVARLAFHMAVTRTLYSVVLFNINIIHLNEMGALLFLRYTIMSCTFICFRFTNTAVTVFAVWSLQVINAVALGNIHVRDERGDDWTLWVVFTSTAVGMRGCKIHDKVCDLHKKRVRRLLTKGDDLVLFIPLKSHANDLTRVHHLWWHVGVVELNRCQRE